MYDFSYRQPQSVAEAIDLLGEDEDAMLLAGGQTLLPTLKHRLTQPEFLVDLSALNELKGISVENNRVIIGAMTRHAEVAANTEIQRVLPALSHLAGGIGDPMVRNMGTLGGSVANSDPAADYPGAVLGLNAFIHTDRRVISGEDYFLGIFETALEQTELITRIEFPIPSRAGYMIFHNPASGYVVVGAFVADFSGQVRVAINGAGPCVFREKQFERALTEHFSPESLTGLVVSPERLNNDIHATAEYRAHLAGVMAIRAARQTISATGVSQSPIKA